MKFINKHIVYHVGQLDPSKKAHLSHETNLGISVSEVPKAWRAITPLAGEYYKFTNPHGRFLDKHALSEKDKRIILEWGDDMGLIEKSTVYKVTYYDDEMESDISSLYRSREEAEREAETPEDIEEVSDYYTPTSRFNKIIGWKISPVMAEDYLIILYAHEKLNVDGVWFDDDLDVLRYSAPRGTIFDNRLKNWKIERTDDVPQDDGS